MSHCRARETGSTRWEYSRGLDPNKRLMAHDSASPREVARRRGCGDMAGPEQRAGWPTFLWAYRDLAQSPHRVALPPGQRGRRRYKSSPRWLPSRR